MSGRVLATVCLCTALVSAALAAPAARVAAEEAESAQEEEEEEELWERLTEREDKRRPLEPKSIVLRGRRLTIGGEYENELSYSRRRVIGKEEDGSDVKYPDRFLMEQGLTVEAFHSIGRQLSIFAQLHLAYDEDLLAHTRDGVSDFYLEREEMWLHKDDFLGSDLSLEVGRLNFEDARRWWWDEELDAVRLAFEGDTAEASLALARELAPRTTDHSHVEPEHERLVRAIAEASWEWRPSQVLQLFFLRQADRSAREDQGEIVRSEREDDSDARLTWLGARLIGALELESKALLGYWLDGAWVRGRERRVEFEPRTPERRHSTAQNPRRRDVRGWAFDAGASWLATVLLEPRLFAGCAVGSGDSERGETDHSFQQTGIATNEAGFGGVERFGSYGFLLDPELTNLVVWTLGLGVSLFDSSSLDLVYHDYRLLERRGALRLGGDLLEASLTGRDTDVGREIDLVLALEEWERLEFALVGAAFSPGSALGSEEFGSDGGRWSYGGFFAVRWAF